MCATGSWTEAVVILLNDPLNPSVSKMDIRDENNHISERMQSEEAPSTPEDAAVGILEQTSYPLPPLPFPNGTPAPPQPASDPQTGGFVSHILPEPAPPVYQQLVPLMGSAPAHLYSQPGTDSQGQLRHPEVVTGLIEVLLIKMLKTVGLITLLSACLYFTFV